MEISNEQITIINTPQRAGIRFATRSDPNARFYQDLMLISAVIPIRVGASS
jgi:hypothetical protein